MADKWYSIGQWDQPLLFTSIESEFSKGKYYKILSPHLASGFRVVSRHFYFEMKMYRQIKILVEHTNYAEKFIRYHRIAFNNLRKNIQKYSPQKIENDKEAIKLFQLFVQTNRDVAYFFDASLPLDDIILQKILKRIDFTTAANLVKVKKLTDINRELQSLKQISRQLSRRLGQKFLREKPKTILGRLRQANSPILKRLQKHAANFSYLPMQTFRGQPWTLTDYIARAQDMTRKHNPVLEQIAKIPRLDKTTKKFITLARSLNECRGERIELLNKWIWRLDPLWKYLERKLNVSHEEFISMTYQEVLKVLSTARLSVTKKELGLRNNAYSSLWLNGKFTYRSSPLVAPKPQKVKEIKGYTAYPGKVVGQAKIIRGADDFKKFRANDILIAPLTTPNFVVVMSKASAIVTDVGGITSHAAVVSRELHIPCIVGTKNATEVFKDNDWVRVDTSKGTVSKIHR